MGECEILHGCRAPFSTETRSCPCFVFPFLSAAEEAETLCSSLELARQGIAGGLTFSTVKNSKTRHHYSQCRSRMCSPPCASYPDFYLARSLCGQVGEAPAQRVGSTGGHCTPSDRYQQYCSCARFMSQGVTYFQSHSVCNRGCQTYLYEQDFFWKQAIGKILIYLQNTHCFLPLESCILSLKTGWRHDSEILIIKLKL